MLDGYDSCTNWQTGSVSDRGKPPMGRSVYYHPNLRNQRNQEVDDTT